MPIFPEEQLDSPLGYYPIQPGQTLKDGQWTVIRKLGWGPRSSTWLAVNTAQDQFRAIKILTTASTFDATGRNELQFHLGPLKNWEDLVQQPLDHFYEYDSRGRKHLCFVFRVIGSSVEELRLSNIYDGQKLPLHVVKKVIGDISQILSHLAGQDIIHGALTADNFMFWTVQADTDIKPVLSKSPNARAEKIQGSDGVFYPAVKSQPIPHGYEWDATADVIACASLFLCNYAHARDTFAVTLDSPKNYLPPEALLKGGRIGPPSDIWTLGCTTYLLLTGKHLFDDSYVASPIKVIKETLGRIDELLLESDNVGKKDMVSTASFIRECIDIVSRPSASDIFNGSWITKGCSCGWCGDEPPF